MTPAVLLLVSSLALAGEAGGGTVAVVDLSDPPQTAVADALKRVPDLRGRTLSAQKTAAIVRDAEGLGLACEADDVDCLQKLVVLGRIDELVAFALEDDTVVISRVRAGEAKSERVTVVGTPTTRARKAWAALNDDDAPPRLPTPPEKPIEPVETVEEPRDLEDTEDGSARDRPDPPVQTPTASSGGVSPSLVVAVAGSAAALGLGAATVGVSAEMAKRLRATEQGFPLDDSYYGLEAGFWTLGAFTVIAVATAGAGIAWLLMEETAPTSSSGSPPEDSAGALSAP